jgi:hypothetical protein
VYNTGIAFAAICLPEIARLARTRAWSTVTEIPRSRIQHSSRLAQGLCA